MAVSVLHKQAAQGTEIVDATVRRSFPFGYAGRHLFLVLTAYLDASGSADSQALTVAGYVSSDARLKHFGAEWFRLLRRYRLNDGFHMTDFVAGAEPYRRWGKKREERLLEFIRVVNRAAIFPVSVTIPIATYSSALSEDQRARCGNPYFVAAWGCFHEVTKWLRANRPPEDEVAYVYDQGDQGRGEVFKAFNFVYDDHELRKMHRLISMDFQSKMRFTPIQAADILAWTVQDDVLRSIGVDRRPRPESLAQLRLSEILYPTPDQLREIVNHFAAADIRRGSGWKTQPIHRADA